MTTPMETAQASPDPVERLHAARTKCAQARAAWDELKEI